MRLGLQRHDARFLGRCILRMRRIPHHHPTRLEHGHQIGEGMLLEQTDDAIELNPLLRVRQRFVERRLRCPQSICREDDPSRIERAARPSLAAPKMTLSHC